MLLALLFFGCSTPCNLEDQAMALLPSDAIDCVDDMACFATAVSEGEPARATSASQGIDSVVSTAHVYTGDRLWWLSHDSFGGGEIDARECVNPEVVDGEIVCGRVAPLGNHFAVCGNQGRGSPEPLPFEP